MSFPVLSAPTAIQAKNALSKAAIAAGLVNPGLSEIDFYAWILSELLGNVAANGNGVVQIGTLAVSGVAAEKFKTTTVLYWRRLGIQFTKAATDNLTFTAAHTINTGAAAGIKYGVFLIQISDTGTVATKVPSADQVYTTAAAALAAKPAVDSGYTEIGSLVIGAKTGASWTANTDDMTAASDCASIVIYDATPVTLPAASA